MLLFPFFVGLRPKQGKGRPSLHFPEDVGDRFSHGGLGRAVSWHAFGIGWPPETPAREPVPFPVEHPPRGEELRGIRCNTSSGGAITNRLVKTVKQHLMSVIKDRLCYVNGIFQSSEPQKQNSIQHQCVWLK